MKKKPSIGCPCGNGAAYESCCGRWHAGKPAPDPESLMRSRYSAYVLGLDDYLHATWAAETRPENLDLQAEPRLKWIGLEIVGQQMMDANTATVEFVARYKVNGRAGRLHEVSRFSRIGGRWFYVAGDTDWA